MALSVLTKVPIQINTWSSKAESNHLLVLYIVLGAVKKFVTPGKKIKKKIKIKIKNHGFYYWQKYEFSNETTFIEPNSLKFLYQDNKLNNS